MLLLVRHQEQDEGEDDVVDEDDNEEDNDTVQNHSWVGDGDLVRLAEAELRQSSQENITLEVWFGSDQSPGAWRMRRRLRHLGTVTDHLGGF